MQPRKPSLIQPGSFAAVIRAFMSSPYYGALEPTTRLNYGRYLSLAEREDVLGGLPVEVIRPAIIQAFLDGLSETPGGAQNARTALKSLESWALVRDQLLHRIMDGVKVSREGSGHEPWSIEQVRIAECYARPDLARAVTLAVNTGQRGSDLIRMKWSDLQRHHGKLGVYVAAQQKTKKRLWIPFTDSFEPVVAGWDRHDSEYILTNPKGKPYTRILLSCAWTRERDTNPRLVALAGRVLHGLRATAVSEGRRQGLTELQISNLYGMSEQMVARYSRLANQTEMALAAVATLDRAEADKTPKDGIKVLQFRRR